MTSFRTLLLGSAMLVAASSADAATAVLFDSLSGSSSAGALGVAGSQFGPIGLEFTTNSTGTVDSVSLALSGNFTNVNGSVLVSILADMGNAPVFSSPIFVGTVLDSALGASLATISFTSLNITGLSASSPYWLVLQDTSTSEAITTAGWSFTTDSLGVGVPSSYIYAAGGSADFGTQGFIPQAEILSHTASQEGVPEPASMSLLGAGLIGLAALRRRLGRRLSRFLTNS